MQLLLSVTSLNVLLLYDTRFVLFARVHSLTYIFYTYFYHLLTAINVLITIHKHHMLAYNSRSDTVRLHLNVTSYDNVITLPHASHRYSSLIIIVITHTGNHRAHAPQYTLESTIAPFSQLYLIWHIESPMRTDVHTCHIKANSSQVWNDSTIYRYDSAVYL